jgi:para-aminobenzoate synthetase component I
VKSSEQSFQRALILDGQEVIDVARDLQWLGGLVFFDSSGNLPEQSRDPISVISAAPKQIYRGSIHLDADRSELRRALSNFRILERDHGFPNGGLCGWVDYEGHYVLGEYHEMLIKNEATGEWWEKGELSLKRKNTASKCPAISKFTAEITREEFLNSIEKAKQWIASGDIYQVNLAQKFSAKLEGAGSLFGLYEQLRQASPAPMSAWLELDEREILSSSPELFLRISGNGIETRPIKGTRPRFRDADDDLRSAVELQTSSKEAAELVMITDLLRNDLGKVCEFGSVEVTKMLQLESLAQVHHLVSTVRGSLRTECDAVTALAECFPGGSITGAPKKRAMEIISELENAPRGIYCGAIGWFGFNEESQWNIAIRTLVRDSDTLSYHVGAGIVADSTAADEYAETMHKGQGIRLGIEQFRSSL